MTTLSTGKASEFITFSRTSNATVTDSDGKIKWAPHNLLLASEQFDSASWTKLLATVTPNAIAAPNGTLTADKIEATANGAGASQDATGVGDTVTFSAYFKKGNTATSVNSLLIRNQSTATNLLAARVNLDTGAITYLAGSSGATSEDFGNGWWKLTLTTPFTAGNTVRAAIFGGYPSVAGEFSYIWGAHLYRSDLGGMKANASAYPMYNPTTPKNLLGQTETFDVSPWGSSPSGTGVAAVVTSNAGVAPNGLQTADRIQFSLAGGTTTSDITRRQQGFSTTSNVPYTFSFWVKSYDGMPYAMHVVGANGASTALSVTNEWQRVSVTANGNGAAVAFSIGLRGGLTPTNSNTADILVWGAQLSDSASLDTYVPNYGAAPTAAAYYGPRLDFDGSTLAAKGLLVEEARTNLMPRSNEFNNALWLATNLNAFGSGSVANTTATLDPSGQNTADFIQEDSTAAAVHTINANIIVASVVPHTYSCYIKAAGRSWVRLFAFQSGITANAVWFNLGTGQVGTVSAGASNATITSVGNGWYRCSYTFTPASAAAATFYVALATADNETIYNGNGTSGLYVFGAQVEVGSFATSYIPTGAATVTRAADVASVNTQAFPANNTEGSIVVAYNRIGIKRFSRLFTLGDAAGNYQVSGINYDVGNENSYIVAPTISSFKVAGLVPAVNTTNKLGFAFKSGDSAVSLNGAAAVSDTQVFTMVNDVLALGNSLASGQHLNGHIRQITYIPRRLTNTELQTRTA